jgi:3-oxoacyl-[acyl-carrier-protein] synthase II
VFINSSVCISYQPSFLNENLIEQLHPVSDDVELQHPDYKQYVSPVQLRRMSSVLKMGLAAGVEALKQADDAEADAIIVGTGLGCIHDTLKFVEAMYKSEEGTLSPTAFIQSTHNSIAGQLALLLGNRNYNMTHTQGNLSLGYALLDAQLLLSEGDAAQVLVGAVDEMTEDEHTMIAALAEKMQVSMPVLGSGSVFFHISSEKTSTTFARIVSIKMGHNGKANGLLSILAEAELILTNTDSFLSEAEHVRYTDYCGEFFTASGFGLHLALMYLKAREALTHVVVHHRFGAQEMGILVARA